jgi:hypothetical protein
MAEAIVHDRGIADALRASAHDIAAAEDAARGIRTA